jgi:DNA-binding transcriptional ArsR family regulator
MLPTLPLAVIREPAAAAAALDPIRQRLLANLAEPDSATGVARRLRLPRQKVNYHLRALEEAGLVELVEERRKGNCLERVVRASARAFVISPETLGEMAPGDQVTADRFSTSYLIAAAGRTIRDLAELDSRARKAGKRVATLTLEADVRFATAADRAAFAEELADAVARLAAKYHDDRAPGGRHFRLLAAVHPAAPGRAPSPDSGSTG